MSQMTLTQKLATLQPLVDLNLFESSLEYRNRILNLLAEQEHNVTNDTHTKTCHFTTTG